MGKEGYDGYEITFVEEQNKIYAYMLEVTSRPLGEGKNEQDALKSAIFNYERYKRF